MLNVKMNKIDAVRLCSGFHILVDGTETGLRALAKLADDAHEPVL